MNRFVAFLDSALLNIEEDVASHQPERGGALLGPVGQPVISEFIYDQRAATSGVTFQPSQDLQKAVTEAESRNSNIELKGMLHSHPGSMNHPSSGDLVAYADSLRGAPWLGRFICPIVTVGRLARENHEIQTPSGVVSVFVSTLGHGRGLELQPATVQIMPVARDLAALANAARGKALPLGTVELGGIVYVTGGVRLSELEIQLLFPAAYPTEPPIVLATRTAAPHRSWVRNRRGAAPEARLGETVQLPVLWSFEIPDEDRLTSAMAHHLEVVTEKQPRLENTHIAEATPVNPALARLGISERLGNVVSRSLPEKAVLIAGAGSGGSQTADALVRSGVEHFVLIDADSVSPANLSRSVYRLDDVGKPKVEALADHLMAINPMVNCTVVAKRIQEVAPTELDDMIRKVDLVIGATDDPAGQRSLNHFAYARSIPAVYAGMYSRGIAGEIVFVVPGITRCYRCTTASRHQGESQSPSLDYGTGRLSGEPALGADIAHVVTASVKLAIGLLQLDDEDQKNSSRDLIMQALTAGFNYVMLSMVPEWDFFKEIFAGTAGQLAYQSAWLQAQGDAACQVCGQHRVDPLEAPSRAPRVDSLVVVTDLGGSR